MPLHEILTEHPAYKQVTEIAERAARDYDRARQQLAERRARWQEEYERALDSGTALPPPPETNIDQLQVGAALARSGRPERQARAIRQHEDELRAALAAREAELFALVPELVAPLRAVADELQSLGHSMQQVDRATGERARKPATHVIGLDEVDDAVTSGRSFIGLVEVAEPSAPPAREPWVKVEMQGLQPGPAQ